jgi:hypothetical protein
MKYLFVVIWCVTSGNDNKDYSFCKIWGFHGGDYEEWHLHFVWNSYSFQITDKKVETEMITQIMEMIRTESLKTKAAELMNKCGKKGNTMN